MALKNYPGVVRLRDAWEPLPEPGTFKRVLLIYVDRAVDTTGNDPWLIGLQDEISAVLKVSTHDHSVIVEPDT